MSFLSPNQHSQGTEGKFHSLTDVLQPCFLWSFSFPHSWWSHVNDILPWTTGASSELCVAVWQSKQRQLGDVMDLSSYLLKPIQRLSKYAQLLKQIAKECPSSYPAYADLMVSLCFHTLYCLLLTTATVLWPIVHDNLFWVGSRNDQTSLNPHYWQCHVSSTSWVGRN